MNAAKNVAKRIPRKRPNLEEQANFDGENFERGTEEFLEAGKVAEQKGHVNGIDTYMRQFRKYPPLTSDEDYAYLYDKFHNGTDVEKLRARDLIVYGNARLVLKVALRYRGRGMELEDMLQEGMIALFEKALPKWEPPKGRFSTYAYTWIRQAIMRALQDKNESTAYRIPVHYQDNITAIRRLLGEFYLSKGRFPTDMELYELVKSRDSESMQKLSLADVVKLKKHLWSRSDKPLRLDASTKLYTKGEGEEGTPLGDFIHDGPPKTETIVEARRLYLEYRKALARITEAVDELPPRSAMVVRLRYGLGDFHAMTLEEIGKRYEVTRERIRQIEAHALNTLSEKLGITSQDIEEMVDVMQDLEVIAHAV